MSKSLARNILYNLLFQFVTLFIPLITLPYISRVLGKEGIGVYSYTLSITQYFIILGTLGISLYGNRQVAYVRDDKVKLSKTFWSIISINMITTSIALIIYILIFGFDKKYGNIYMIQSLNIVANIVNISWLYMGLEDFKKTVTRNLLVKIFGVGCIFIFVKTYDDLYKYIIINGLMILCGNLVMWLYLPKTVLWVKVKFIDLKYHIIPILKLFIPQMAIQVYAVLDRSMLGSLTNTSEVGLYDQSQKIVKLVLGLVTSLGVVMLPRMSNIFVNGDKKKMNNYLNKSLFGVAYVSIPMAYGLVSISKEFVPWFFGNNFKEVSFLMSILSPILFFIAMSNVLGIQYLLPTNRTKKFTSSVIIGALVNVILNFTLIPTYKAIGACISTVVAEFSVTIIQYIFVKEYIDTKKFMSYLIKYNLISMIMFVFVKIIGIYMGIGVSTTVIQCIIGLFIYVGILYAINDSINKFVIGKLINKFTSLKKS